MHLFYLEMHHELNTPQKLKMTAQDIVELGIADKILPEPGGGHNDWGSHCKYDKTKFNNRT